MRSILFYFLTISAITMGTHKARAINWNEYHHIDPKHEVPTQALQQAISYYDQIKDKISNPRYLTVIDFSQHSRSERFFLINMKTGDVEALKVAHGQGSDSNHDGLAEKFSNQPNSKASSLGFYLTGEIYQGKYGTSLKLDGLSVTNSNARARAVVVHGAPYVSDELQKIGRSWGCPALDQKHSKRVIETIKEGSLIYAWRGQKPVAQNDNQ